MDKNEYEIEIEIGLFDCSQNTKLYVEQHMRIYLTVTKIHSNVKKHILLKTPIIVIRATSKKLIQVGFERAYTIRIHNIFR